MICLLEVAGLGDADLSEELLLGKFLAGNVCSKENPIALLTSPMNIIK